jgi:PLP dependent protein
MSIQMPIAKRLAEVCKRIDSATERAGRPGHSVRLVAVSKTYPVSALMEAYQAGQRIFGENYVQELLAKATEITVPVEWHFIGHLQSNKVRQIAGLVTLIHSVDRLSLAEEISRQWGRLGKICDILVQVNISGESTKSGTTEAGAVSLITDIALLPNIRIVGLMTMPPFFDEPDLARPYFAELKKLSDMVAELKLPEVRMDELSMGMSGDFEAAIQEGATLVRVGTAIFGERS